MSCPLCHSNKLTTIYRVEQIPVFQNKVYDSEKEAKNAVLGDVQLVSCNECRFVFNACFNAALMAYDGHYQNEQAISQVFDAYLEDLVNLIFSKGYADRKVIEIGCGKGTFINKLWNRNVDAIGFDPTYEGEDERVVKDYFSDKYGHYSADLVILRHTLEHIEMPLTFLHTIASALDYRGKVFIEVPSFEWIIKNEAFWDVFYEHCNYFTKSSLCGLFDQSEHGFLFHGQYMYVLADLSALKQKPATVHAPVKVDFSDLLQNYRNFVRTTKNFIIWGAGAKGSTFVNLTDPDKKYISCVVDINPKKANRFIARSGHKIIFPEALNNMDSANILVMNENYFDEIKSGMSDKNFNFSVLGGIE